MTPLSTTAHLARQEQDLLHLSDPTPTSVAFRRAAAIDFLLGETSLDHALAQTGRDIPYIADSVAKIITSGTEPVSDIAFQGMLALRSCISTPAFRAFVKGAEQTYKELEQAGEPIDARVAEMHALSSFPARAFSFLCSDRLTGYDDKLRPHVHKDRHMLPLQATAAITMCALSAIMLWIEPQAADCDHSKKEDEFLTLARAGDTILGGLQRWCGMIEVVTAKPSLALIHGGGQGGEDTSSAKPGPWFRKGGWTQQGPKGL